MTKLVLAAIVALSGSIAFAGKLDAEQYNYEDGKGMPITACAEGSKKSFYEPRPAPLDGMVNVVRTCKNGSYFAKTKTVGKGCVEGRRSLFTEVDMYDRAITTAYVCVNGKYVKAN